MKLCQNYLCSCNYNNNSWWFGVAFYVPLTRESSLCGWSHLVFPTLWLVDIVILPILQMRKLGHVQIEYLFTITSLLNRGTRFKGRKSSIQELRIWTRLNSYYIGSQCSKSLKMTVIQTDMILSAMEEAVIETKGSASGGYLEMSGQRTIFGDLSWRMWRNQGRERFLTERRLSTKPL